MINKIIAKKLEIPNKKDRKNENNTILFALNGWIYIQINPNILTETINIHNNIIKNKRVILFYIIK